MRKGTHESAGFRRFCLWTIATALCASALGAAQVNPARESRIPGREVLDRAAKAWETIADYQTVLHHVERHESGETKEFWARVYLVKGTKENPEPEPVFLLQFYDHPVPLVAADQVENSTPEEPFKVYFSDVSRKFYTYDAVANTLKIEWLDEQTSPLPEFMYLAGFLDFDIETLKEKAYIDAKVLEETLGNTPTYKVRVIPRTKMKDVEPVREIWIDRETNLPKRFAVPGENGVQVDFGEMKINQGLKSDALIPEIREDAYVVDMTQ